MQYGSYAANKQGDATNWGTGVHTCKSDETANTDHTACVSASLPNLSLPVISPVAPIAKQEPIVNPIGAGLSSTTPTCSAGQVFSGGKCISCTTEAGWVSYAKENRKFCPEGNKQGGGLSVYQQFKKCPKGAWPNATLSDCDCKYGLTMQNNKCVGQISSEHLYYGPSGKNAPLFKQCWTKTSEKAYKKCMGFDD